MLAHASNRSHHASNVPPGRLNEGDSQVSGNWRFLMKNSTPVDDSNDKWQNPPITTEAGDGLCRRDSVHADDGSVLAANGARWSAEQSRMLGWGEGPSSESTSKKRFRANDSTGTLSEQTPRRDWALAPVFTPESGGGIAPGHLCIPPMTITPETTLWPQPTLADYAYVTECTRALANATGRDDRFQPVASGPEFYLTQHPQHKPRPPRSAHHGKRQSNHHAKASGYGLQLYTKRLSPQQVMQNCVNSQRSLREVFAHIQSRIERFVTTRVANPIELNIRDDHFTRPFIQRSIKHIGNQHEAFKILMTRPDLHPALVSGLLWQLARILIFHEPLMDTFNSQHALPFKEAWAIEMEGRRKNPAHKTHEAAKERAEIAHQIIKIPGFWSRWRLQHAHHLNQQFLNALYPAWSTPQTSPVAGDGEHGANEQDGLSSELEYIVRLMIEVAVRLRQDTDWYDLRLPHFSEVFDTETMVVSRTLPGTQGGSFEDAPLSVHLAKSPSLVRWKVRNDDQKVSCIIEYQAEVLLGSAQQVVNEGAAPSPASWSDVEDDAKQISSRRKTW